MELSQPTQDTAMSTTGRNHEEDLIANAASSSKMSDPVDGKDANHTNTDKKKAIRPVASVMVLESIQSLNKRIGSTPEEIYQQIETAYNVEIKKVKPYVNRFLNGAVEKGLLENAGGVGDKARFKAKQSASVKKETQRSKEGVKKKTKAASATKRQKPKEGAKKEKAENKPATKRQKPKEAVEKEETDKKSATKRPKSKETAKKEKTAKKSATKRPKSKETGKKEKTDKKSETKRPKPKEGEKKETAESKPVTKRQKRNKTSS